MVGVSGVVGVGVGSGVSVSIGVAATVGLASDDDVVGAVVVGNGVAGNGVIVGVNGCDVDMLRVSTLADVRLDAVVGIACALLAVVAGRWPGVPTTTVGR